MFSPYFIIPLLIQVALIVHVIRTGRNSLWIWAIALIPLAGSVAYIVVEILPAMFGGETARRARRGVQRVIDPDKDLRQASAQVAISGNVDSRKRLGEQLFERGQYAQAAEAFQGGLSGIFEHDPTLLLGLARSQFALDEFSAARAALDRLIEHNPDFKSTEGHLLYARALEAEGNSAQALKEYAVLEGSYPGAEARLRYGLLLRRVGQEPEARRVLHERFKFSAFDWSVNSEIPAPAGFETAAKYVRPEDLGAMSAGPDADAHVAGIKKYIDAGYNRIALTAAGPDQASFIQFFKDKLRPALEKIL